MYAEWVEEVLRRELCPTNAPWFSHQLRSFEGSLFNHRQIGELNRQTMEEIGLRLEGLEKRIEANLREPEDREKYDEARLDLNRLKAAFELLQELKADVKREHIQANARVQEEMELNPKIVPQETNISELGLESERDAVAQAPPTEGDALHAKQAEPIADLFLVNPAGAMRRASGEEMARALLAKCKADQASLLTRTDMVDVQDAINFANLAAEWAAEIKQDDELRAEFTMFYLQAVNHLGLLRAQSRKNGELKRGKPQKNQPAFNPTLRLNQNVIKQADKLAKFTKEEFEARLMQAKENGTLCKTTTLADPPPPREPDPAGLFYRLLKALSDDPEFWIQKEGYWDEHRWAVWIGAHRSKLRAFVRKIEARLGPE